MGIKRQAAWVVAILWAVLLTMDPAFAVEPAKILTGVTGGQGKISGENLSAAKQAAEKEALNVAVQNAFASLVSRQVFGANLEFLYGRILPRTSDYVITYRVMGGVQHKGYYLVGVESKINLELLEKQLTDARILNVATDKPVILFLIAEQTPEDLLPRYWWGNNPEPYTSLSETIILEQMVQDRFKTVGGGPDRPSPSLYNIRFSSIYDAEAAMALGRALKADMVVLGKAGAQESMNRMEDGKIFDGEIELTVYDLNSGKEVMVSINHATAKSVEGKEGARGVISEISVMAARELSQKIDLFWSQNLRRENSFTVTISGEDFLPRFIALKKRLNEIQEIQNLQPREIGSDNAVMEITFKGSPEQFADAVMLKTFVGFGIEVAEVTDQTVSIRFVEKKEELSPAEGLPQTNNLGGEQKIGE